MPAKQGSVRIRPVVTDDMEALVEIHLESFPNFFLTFLGRDFLTLLYDGIRRDSTGVLLVAEASGKLQGFVAGTTDQSGFYRRLIRKRLLAFVRCAVSAAVRRPSVIPRLFRALRRPGDAEKSAAHACLMSIAVHPDCQGCGVGRKLVEEFGGNMARRAIHQYCLATDRDRNDPVNCFYQRLGFCLARTFITPEGRWMNEYVIDLTDWKPSAGMAQIESAFPECTKMVEHQVDESFRTSIPRVAIALRDRARRGL